MKLVSWNVNGIRSVIRKGDFAKMVHTLDPDVLCLQETKAQQGQAEIDLPQYEEYWNSAVKKGYAGTAIFTKEKPIAIFYDLPEKFVKQYKVHADEFGDPNKEGRVLVLEMKHFYIATVYTPNAKGGSLARLTLRHKHWDPAFLAYMKQLEEKKPVIFCGDLNVARCELDIKNAKANEGEAGYTTEEREGAQHIIEVGFVDTFREFEAGGGHYTWWSNFGNARANNTGWRIDYFLISQSLRGHLTSARIHTDIYGSDHCPVSIEMKRIV
jgi:exodeoxyribonuclease III